MDKFRIGSFSWSSLPAVINAFASTAWLFALSKLTDDKVEPLYAFVFFVECLLNSLFIFDEFFLVFNLQFLKFLLVKSFHFFNLLLGELINFSLRATWCLRLLITGLFCQIFTKRCNFWVLSWEYLLESICLVLWFL